MRKTCILDSYIDLPVKKKTGNFGVPLEVHLRH